MKRLVAGLILGLTIGSALAWVWTWASAERTTLSRLAPDETRRASLVERARPSTERSFEIRLEDLVQGATSTLFRSPVVGGPSGSERLIWSKDGRWLVLLGRHFFVKTDLFLENGDQVYYLHDGQTGKAWLNSAEANELPGLDPAAIDRIEFTEPIHWKRP